MALLITKENRPIFIPAAQANLLWLVKTGERKGTKKTRAKAEMIAKWYLNRATAPPSWRAKNPLAGEPKPSRQMAQPSLPYKD